MILIYACYSEVTINRFFFFFFFSYNAMSLSIKNLPFAIAICYSGIWFYITLRDPRYIFIYIYIIYYIFINMQINYDITNYIGQDINYLLIYLNIFILLCAREFCRSKEEFFFIVLLISLYFLYISIACIVIGELYYRWDPCHDGQKKEYQEHVRHCACGSWKVNFDRLPCIQSRHHCRCQSWWD